MTSSTHNTDSQLYPPHQRRSEGRKLRSWLPLLAAACLIAATVRPASAGVLRLSDLPLEEPAPQAHAPGPVAWESDSGSDLLLWDGMRVRQLTDAGDNLDTHYSTLDDASHWQMNDAGQIAWQGLHGGQHRIYRWDGTAVQQISPDGQDAGLPQINAAGEVVWEAGGQIYLWDGAGVRQLSGAGTANREPRINRRGHVVWTGDQVYFWDGATTRQISHGGLYPIQILINDSDELVWVERGGKHAAVHVWDGSSDRNLGLPQDGEDDPQLADSGQVMWRGSQHSGTLWTTFYLWDGAQIRQFQGNSFQMNRGGQFVWLGGKYWRDVYFWDGSSVRQLNSLGPSTSPPRINDAGEVVWAGHADGTSLVQQVYLWDGHSSRQLTRNRFDNITFGPEFTRSGRVLWYNSGLFLYTPPAPGSVEFDPTPVWERTPSTGVVTLKAPAPQGGTLVALASDNPAAASVPASVTVPVGEVSATFTITTFPVPTSTDVTISAAAAGEQWKAPLRVSHSVIHSVRVGPDRLVGGESGEMGVTLAGPALPNGEGLSFVSDNPAVASVQYGEVKTAHVDAITTVHLFASYGGRTARTTLTVLPVWVKALLLDSQQVVGGSSVTGSVVLSGPAPAGGAAVSLSTYSLAASVPASVTVPAGATAAPFTVTTYPVVADESLTIDTPLSSTSNNGVPASVTLRVLSDHRSSVEFRTLYDGVQGGDFMLDSPAPAGGLVITLTSSNPALVSVPFTTSVAAGSQAASFTVSTQPVSDFTPVVVTAAAEGKTWTGTVVLAPPVIGGVEVDPDWIPGGTTVVGTAFLSGPAPPGGQYVPLSSSDPDLASVPPGVMVPAGAPAAVFAIHTSPVAQLTTVSLRSSVSLLDSYRPALLTLVPTALFHGLFTPSPPEH